MDVGSNSIVFISSRCLVGSLSLRDRGFEPALADSAIHHVRRYNHMDLV